VSVSVQELQLAVAVSRIRSHVSEAVSRARSQASEAAQLPQAERQQVGASARGHQLRPLLDTAHLEWKAVMSSR